MKEYVVDVKDKPLGRAASEIAFILQGKNTPQYEPRKRGENSVLVKNPELVKLTGSKAEQKVYYRHSGKPGSLRKIKYIDIFSKNPQWVIRHAVRGMLPGNRLRTERLKLLKFETNLKDNG